MAESRTHQKHGPFTPMYRGASHPAAHNQTKVLSNAQTKQTRYEKQNMDTFARSGVVFQRKCADAARTQLIALERFCARAARLKREIQTTLPFKQCPVGMESFR